MLKKIFIVCFILSSCVSWSSHAPQNNSDLWSMFQKVDTCIEKLIKAQTLFQPHIPGNDLFFQYGFKNITVLQTYISKLATISSTTEDQEMIRCLTTKLSDTIKYQQKLLTQQKKNNPQLYIRIDSYDSQTSE